MNLLVDMDGVLADLEAGFWPIFAEKCPDAPQIRREDRSTFYVEDQIGQEWRAHVEPIIHSEGFFRSLPVVPGAVEGLLKLCEKHRVTICTSPVTTPWCASEKHSWVLEHLGRKFAKEMIVTKDKTLIRGDVLIDDRPEVKGKMVPVWEHILYDQPYNRHIDKFRLDWGQVLDGTASRLIGL